MLHAFRNRLLVALAVVIIAVIVGTAAAILINSVSGRLRTTLQDMMIATILIPGVMIGIPTMIMWTMIGGVLFGADRPWPFIPGLSAPFRYSASRVSTNAECGSASASITSK